MPAYVRRPEKPPVTWALPVTGPTSLAEVWPDATITFGADGAWTAAVDVEVAPDFILPGMELCSGQWGDYVVLDATRQHLDRVVAREKFEATYMLTEEP